MQNIHIYLLYKFIMINYARYHIIRHHGDVLPIDHLILFQN